MATKRQHIIAPIEGMHCASCAATVQKTLRKVKGVENADVNYATEKAHISYDPEQVSPQDLQKKISPLGYNLDVSQHHETLDHPVTDDTHQGHDHSAVTKASLVARYRTMIRWSFPLTVITFLLMMWDILTQYFSFLPMLPTSMDSLRGVFFLIATAFIITIGSSYLKAVLSFFSTRVANMDTLVGLGTGTAYIYSVLVYLFSALTAQLGLPNHLYFDVTIVVLGFITLGKFLELRSKYQTGEALRKLASLQAKTALVKRGNDFIELPVHELQVDDVILIKPGTKVPIDAVIVDGSSAVDESMVTGEPLPVEKNVDDTVIGGTLNADGVLTAKVKKVGSETMLAQIMKLVEDAQGSKAPVEKLVDQVAAIFVPFVIVVSLLSLLAWSALGFMEVVIPGMGQLSTSQGVLVGLTSFVGVLIIACPCALGLATPTAVVVGVGRAAQAGILIKNAEALELLRKVTAVVVDKTGTLTQGKPTVTDVLTVGGITREYLLSLLASLEANSEHPIAHAVVTAAKEENVSFQKVTEFSILRGQGITGNIEAVKYYAGNAALAQQHGHEVDKEYVRQFTAEGKTPLFVFNNQDAIGIVMVADVVKDNAAAAVKKLQKKGIKVIMATGDDQQTAKFIADQVGITHVLAEALPDKKVELIKQLQADGEKVAMVGDGINDAPALATADVGLAMSTGTDIAMSAAQVVLLKGDINKVSHTIELSRQTVTIIRQNLFWAFIYNVIGIPLAAGLFYPILGSLLNPAFAGLAMAMSSVSVVLNSLRLKTVRMKI